MHILITEEQLKKLIKEELGVSEKVIAASNELFRMLMEKISEGFKNGQKEITMSQFSSSFIFMWGDIKISVHFDVFNYRNNEFYEYSKVGANASSAWVSKKLFFLWLTVPMVSGNVVGSDIKDSIQHELEHIFQQSMFGKPFSDAKRYAKMRMSLESENENERKAARLVYACLKSEQEGFCNGMYSYLMSVPEPVSMHGIMKTPAWKTYKEACEVFEEAANNEDLKNEFKKYGLKLKTIKKLLDNFAKRIGRVASKVKEDKYKKQNWKD